MRGGIKYHFLSLWYDWTQISRATGEHSNHHVNVRYNVNILLNKESKTKSKLVHLAGAVEYTDGISVEG